MGNVAELPPHRNLLTHYRPEHYRNELSDNFRTTGHRMVSSLGADVHTHGERSGRSPTAGH